eukprot:Colp12_sorted_trinity150504_noHs@28162
MRLPKGFTNAERHTMVEDTLLMLGLARVRDSLIGNELVRGISGGQRKRVNVGIEVVADPKVIFLDEPTSGLDATSSLTVLQSLKELAVCRNTAVVAVIHQPRYDLFMLFDDLLLLGVGGVTVYNGPTKDVEPYFQSLGFVVPPKANPADFFID